MREAASKGLRKSSEHIYVPVATCPLAFERGEEFKVFLNRVLNDTPLYHRRTRYLRELLDYLQNYDPPECRNIVVDQDLVSFSNGVLQLSSRTFHETDRMPADFASKVARHCIPQPYTGSHETPLLDRILLAQFGHEVAEALCAMLGRCMFKVNQLDRWQVMAYIAALLPYSHFTENNISKRC